MFIYILELEQNKYYIGKTTNIAFRLKDHFTSNGSAWTRKYKPIQVQSIIADCDDYDEDKYTLKYMEKYGINNVRGGSFCQMIISNSNIETLKQIISHKTDSCYLCGVKGHYANKCNNKIINIQEPIKEDNTDNNIKKNKKCDCIMSSKFPHRKKFCTLNNIFK